MDITEKPYAQAALAGMIRAILREEIAAPLADLRRFVDRRFAELSNEVHGTAQLLDFSESNLSSQLARIHDQVATVIAAPSQEARNSGMELEAVVQVTETAANQIMEAAEAIADWLRDGARDATGIAAVADRINAIFEACSFQDLTSQRIRRAISHLQQVDTMLAGLSPKAPNTANEPGGTKPGGTKAGGTKAGTTEPNSTAPGIMPVGGTGSDLDQAAIDAMLA